MKRIVTAVLLIIALVLAASTIYFFHQYQQVKKQYQKFQNTTSQAEVQQITNEVSKLMLLPKNETPTIATVNDITKLKDQPFFVNAKNGDKVLIYPNASIAILYDPAAHLIINVSPITLGNNTPPTPIPTVSVSSTPTPTVRQKPSPTLTPSPTP